MTSSKSCSLQPRGQVALPRRLQLKEPDGAPVADDLVGRRVVGRQLVGTDAPPRALPDEVHALRDGRVGAQAQDVHLDQAQGGDIVLVELHHHHPFRRPLERGVVGDGPVGYDEPAQVRAQVEGEGVQALDQVQEAGVAALGARREGGAWRPGIRRLIHPFFENRASSVRFVFFVHSVPAFREEHMKYASSSAGAAPAPRAPRPAAVSRAARATPRPGRRGCGPASPWWGTLAARALISLGAKPRASATMRTAERGLAVLTLATTATFSFQKSCRCCLSPRPGARSRSPRRCRASRGGWG